MTTGTITQAALKEILHYDPDTGAFRWRRTRNKKNAKAGDLAGCVRSNGHRVIGIDNRNFLAARLAFLYMNGDHAAQNIYRINGDADDLSWNNLVLGKNVRKGAGLKRSDRPYRNNVTGLRGVSYSISNKRFQAAIFVKGMQLHLGYFDTPDEAHNAYCDAVAPLR